MQNLYLHINLYDESQKVSHAALSASALVLSINSHYNTGSLCGRDDQKSNLGLFNGT